MKYWDCINIPGVTNVEGAQTSAPSIPVTPPVAVVGDIEPSNDKTPQSQDGVLSEEYIQLANNAFGIGINRTLSDVYVNPTTTEDVPNEHVEIAIPDNIETVDVVGEESASKYMSPDEVNISDYDIDNDSPYICAGVDIATSTDITQESTEPIVSTPVISKEQLLSGILSTSGTISIGNDIDTKAPTSDQTIDDTAQYSLDDSQLTFVIESLNKYEEKYFKEIPIKHISNRFLRNITKTVYRAHQDAVEKYEDPDLMDPIFLLYPLTTEDPYMAMGKFWDIVTSKIANDPEWSTAVIKSVKDYDEYMLELAEEENEDDDDVNDNESNE